MREFDTPALKMTGEITDKIYKNGELIEERVGHNLVVNSFLPLIARFMTNEEVSGIQYWAIGQGEDSWDITTPAPTMDDTELVSEIGRISIEASDISYLDDEFNPVDEPTHIIQIKHTFDENTLNGSWREFGIFGGNASSAIGSGTMINHRIHARLEKTSEISVERIMRFILSLV